jgi:hypothetical protein
MIEMVIRTQIKLGGWGFLGHGVGQTGWMRTGW